MKRFSMTLKPTSSTVSLLAKKTLRKFKSSLAWTMRACSCKLLKTRINCVNGSPPVLKSAKNAIKSARSNKITLTPALLRSRGVSLSNCYIGSNSVEMTSTVSLLRQISLDFSSWCCIRLISIWCLTLRLTLKGTKKLSASVRMRACSTSWSVSKQSKRLPPSGLKPSTLELLRKIEVWQINLIFSNKLEKKRVCSSTINWLEITMVMKLQFTMSGWKAFRSTCCCQECARSSFSSEITQFTLVRTPRLAQFFRWWWPSGVFSFW